MATSLRTPCSTRDKLLRAQIALLAMLMLRPHGLFSQKARF